MMEVNVKLLFWAVKSKFTYLKKHHIPSRKNVPVTLDNLAVIHWFYFLSKNSPFKKS